MKAGWDYLLINELNKSLRIIFGETAFIIIMGGGSQTAGPEKKRPKTVLMQDSVKRGAAGGVPD